MDYRLENMLLLIMVWGARHFYAIFSHFLISKDPQQVISCAVARGSLVAGVKDVSW